MFSTFRANAWDRPKSMYTTSGPSHSALKHHALTIVWKFELHWPFREKWTNWKRDCFKLLPSFCKLCTLTQVWEKHSENRDCTWPWGLAPAGQLTVEGQQVIFNFVQIMLGMQHESAAASAMGYNSTWAPQRNLHFPWPSAWFWWKLRLSDPVLDVTMHLRFSVPGHVEDAWRATNEIVEQNPMKCPGVESRRNISNRILNNASQRCRYLAYLGIKAKHL